MKGVKSLVAVKYESADITKILYMIKAIRNFKHLYFYISLLVLFTVSHVWSLLHSGIYWDDWALIGIDPALVQDDFFRNGRPFFGLLHEALLHLPNPIFLYKFLIFAGYFLAGILFFNILQKIRYLEDKDRMFISLLFSLLAYNSSRHSLVIVQYVACLDLFLVGMLIWLKDSRTVFQRSLMFFVFTLSMYIEAFVFLLALLILIFHFYSIKKIEMAYEVPLSIAFFLFLRYFVHPPQDIYVGLNTLNIKNLLLSPLYIIKAFKTNGLDLVSESIKRSFRFVSFLSLTLCCLILVPLFRKISMNKSSYTNEQLQHFVFIGFLLFSAAAFPFIIVGKMPANYDWFSRGQFLLPIGAAFLIYFGFKLVFVDRLQKFALAFTIFLSVHLNVIYGIEYWFDHIKQDALKLHFEQSALLKANTTFLTLDYTENLNARGRTYRLYDYTGLFKQIFNEETRLAYRAQENEPIRKEIDFGYMRTIFSLTDYKWDQASHAILIMPGQINVNNYREALQLLVSSFKSEWFRSDSNVTEYNKLAYNLVTVDVIPIPVLEEDETILNVLSKLAQKNYKEKRNLNESKFTFY